MKIPKHSPIPTIIVTLLFGISSCAKTHFPTYIDDCQRQKNHISEIVRKDRIEKGLINLGKIARQFLLSPENICTETSDFLYEATGNTKEIDAFVNQFAELVFLKKRLYEEFESSDEEVVKVMRETEPAPQSWNLGAWLQNLQTVVINAEKPNISFDPFLGQEASFQDDYQLQAETVIEKKPLPEGLPPIIPRTSLEKRVVNPHIIERTRKQGIHLFFSNDSQVAPQGVDELYELVIALKESGITSRIQFYIEGYIDSSGEDEHSQLVSSRDDEYWRRVDWISRQLREYFFYGGYSPVPHIRLNAHYSKNFSPTEKQKIVVRVVDSTPKNSSKNSPPEIIPNEE